MSSIRVATRVALLGVIAGALHASCRTPTQIELAITTDLSCAELRDVAIVAGAAEGVETGAPNTVTSDCRDIPGGAEIGSIVLAPEGSKDAAVGIKVVAGVDVRAEDCNPSNEHAGCIVARRRLNYVPHTELVLNIPLSRDCLNQDCDPTSTCVDGGCKDSTVRDPEKCTGEGCDEESLGGGTPGTGGGGTGLGGMGGGGGNNANAELQLLELPQLATDVDVIAVSDDGETTVGAVLIDQVWRPCAWVGPEPILLAMPTVAEDGWAEAVSDDGQQIVGWVGGADEIAVRWARQNGGYGGFMYIGDSEISHAYDCDDTCDVVVGRTEVGEVVACRTSINVCTPVPQSAGMALAVTDDGARMVGIEGDHAAAWEVGENGALWTHTTISQATGITPDGYVVVGMDGSEGFYLLNPSLVSSALPLSGGNPRAVAGDASSFTAVGDCVMNACKWDNGDQYVHIQAAFTADYQGYVLRTADDVTSDRRVIVGEATESVSGKRGYRLILDQP